MRFSDWLHLKVWIKFVSSALREYSKVHGCAACLWDFHMISWISNWIHFPHFYELTNCVKFDFLCRKIVSQKSHYVFLFPLFPISRGNSCKIFLNDVRNLTKKNPDRQHSIFEWLIQKFWVWTVLRYLYFIENVQKYCFSSSQQVTQKKKFYHGYERP